MSSNQTEQPLLHSGELASLTGISTDTLRHYERKGVLSCPLRSANGYRQYPREAVLRVQIIQQALQLGFSLDELAGIFRTKDNGGIPCHEVRSIAGKKLEALEERLRELTALRDVLKATLTEWDDKLSRTPSGERAHLLEGMKVITRKASKEKEFPHGRSKRAKA